MVYWIINRELTKLEKEVIYLICDSKDIHVFTDARVHKNDDIQPRLMYDGTQVLRCGNESYDIYIKDHIVVTYQEAIDLLLNYGK